MNPLMLRWRLKGVGARAFVGAFAVAVSLGYLFIGGDLELASISWDAFPEVFFLALGGSQAAFGLLNSSEFKLPSFLAPKG